MRIEGDVTVIGRDVRLSGQPHTVIGVVPDHVRLSRPASVWTLLRSTAVNQRGLRFSQGVGRLKRGVSLESAQAELSSVAAQLAREYPDTNRNRDITIEPLRAGIMGPDLQVTSLLLLGVVGFVLVMCCANVANLLLARATVRAREFAVRSALGAGRGRLIRQLLTESLTLAAFGGLLGIGLSAVVFKGGARGNSARAAARHDHARARRTRGDVLRGHRAGGWAVLRHHAGVAGYADDIGAGPRLGGSQLNTRRRASS